MSRDLCLSVEHYAEAEVLHPGAGEGRVAVRKFGVGPPLVLIHGFPLHGLIFRQLLGGLSRHFTCHVVDMLGAGDSHWTTATDFSFPAQARALDRALSALHLRHYSVMAHDTGGSIARHLALLARDSVERLVLINTEIPGHRPPWIPFWGRVLGVPGSASGLRVLLRSRAFVRSRAGFGGCFRDSTLLDGEFYDRFLAPIARSPRRADGYRRYLRGFDWDENDAMAERHALIRAPVRLLWGRDDPTFPEELARRMLLQFPCADGFESIREACLLPHVERPEAVHDAALPFLRGETREAQPPASRDGSASRPTERERWK
jgi:pimeloyl-ACP methyl ester carboxylesterase